MPDKIGQEAFLYLQPLDSEERFAQCSTCRDWVMEDDRCVIHGPYITVVSTASCGLYVEGAPQQSGTRTESIVTPSETGLTDREVRCENCYHFTDICELFKKLNETLPDLFDIDIHVDSKGCCNANTPR